MTRPQAGQADDAAGAAEIVITKFIDLKAGPAVVKILKIISY